MNGVLHCMGSMALHGNNDDVQACNCAVNFMEAMPMPCQLHSSPGLPSARSHNDSHIIPNVVNSRQSCLS